MFRVMALGLLTFSIAFAQSVLVVNPNFGNVPVQCAGHYALQSSNLGTCEDYYPQQPFDATPGMGWSFTRNLPPVNSAGVTGPNTGFDPPSFAGFPFSQAASLQNVNCVISQVLFGLIPGINYDLSFYLGSRYSGPGSNDGNQTVEARIDNRTVGLWPLRSYTPFILRHALFAVTDGGTHILEFVGRSPGDHTAFFSGVSIVAVVN